MMSRILSRTLLATASALALGPALVVASEPAAGNGADRLRAELHVVVLRLIESGAFGNTAPENIALSLSEPEQRYANVGLLVDRSNTAGARGVRVVGTTPGGSAERLGVKAGDRVLEINGVALADNDSTLAAQLLKQTVDGLKAGDELALTVERDGAAQRLSGPVQTVFVPALRVELGAPLVLAVLDDTGSQAAASVAAALPTTSAEGCGRISVFHIAPQSRDLYEAKILTIDGKIPGPQNQHTYRVTPGLHKVEVAEHIDYRQFAPANDRQRRHKTKELTIEVARDTTYLVAAQFNEDKRYEVGDGSYWDPVVWKEQTESCSR